MSENMQKDLVLSINEYAYVLDETKGHVVCWVGPAKTSLSNSDKLVRFNPKTKTFDRCSYNEVVNLFTIAPENWYVILKNPVSGDRHPKAGGANNLPEDILVGQKINVCGPCSFALYPGQMAKVVKGHSLRSNQYLLARVYEAKAASESQGEMLDAEGKPIETKANYVNGQILVIKGTEVSFYIPPTGIEVIAINNDDRKGYVREAVTLERLEYCILKDEDGNKRYVHGPKVVFPEPTETFVSSSSGGYIFRAIELSKISGIYVKVIAEYTDEKNNVHPVGEEMFITGDSQMIYYPRPEHAIISYDNKIMHHAIAIPEGEGRYIMNRLTGEIKTVKGPAMYLPDPRTEVVVKRKLTPKQCQRWFPGNEEALTYNAVLNEKFVEKSLSKVDMDMLNNVTCYATDSLSTTLASLETKASISRGTSYTKPRTITLDNKYEGVVTINVWTGYAVNVISKDGTREVICGPQTILLDYDQTLEELQMSRGRPKNASNVIKTVYLQHENNKVTDLITVETKDFVRCQILVTYSVSFDKQHQSKWFDVENYVQCLCDTVRAEVRREVKKYGIEELYHNYSTLIRKIAIKENGRVFPENGMILNDCDVLELTILDDIEEDLDAHQKEMIRQSLRLSDAEKRVQVAQELAAAEKAEQELRTQQLMDKMALQEKEAVEQARIASEINRLKEAEARASEQAKIDLDVLTDALHTAALARKEQETKAELDKARELAKIQKAKMEAYAETVKSIVSAVSPDLIAALSTKSNEDLLAAVTQSMAPYAIAKGESVPDVVNKLLRGTSLEGLIEDVNLNV